MATSQPTTTLKQKLTSHSNSAQIRSFLLGQLFGTIPCLSPGSLPSDLPSRTIILTGSNTGLGFEAAKQLHALGVGRLILACRDVEKAEAARREIIALQKLRPKINIKTAGDEAEQKQMIEVYELDMSSTASILTFAERAARTLDRIDAIILNAGVDLVSYRRNEPEGYEMTLMVNVVGTFLLAILMVPVLRKFAAEQGKRMEEAPRISIVGSAVHLFAKYEVLLQAAASEEGMLRWLSDEERWRGKIREDRYFLSKGMVQILVRQLARIVTQSSHGEERGGRGEPKPMVVVNAVNPGYCRTNLFDESSSVVSRIALRLIGRDADVGARGLVVGAVGAEGGAASHGGYMSEGHVREANSWIATAQGEDLGKQLWEEIAELVERVRHGMMGEI